jgi:hypothetical protein
MPIKLAAGTVEIVPVDVVDRSATETDLSGFSPIYTVLDDVGFAWYEDEATTAVLMRILPLLNTSISHPSGAWPVGHYRLFIAFNTGTEKPKLGPIDIYLIDATVVFT